MPMLHRPVETTGIQLLGSVFADTEKLDTGLRRYDGLVEMPRFGRCSCRCFWRQEAARSTRGPVGRGEIAEEKPAQRVRAGMRAVR